MSAAQAMVSEQFLDAMGPMTNDAKVVDQVVTYIRLLRSTQNMERQSMPYSMDEVNTRLDEAEASLSAGQGISETIARQHRHSFVNQLVAR